MENSYTPNAPPPPYPNQNVPLYHTQDGAYGLSGHQNYSGAPVIHNPNTFQVPHQQRQTQVMPQDKTTGPDLIYFLLPRHAYTVIKQLQLEWMIVSRTKAGCGASSAVVFSLLLLDAWPAA